jgi:hypothetical protein
MSNQSFIDYYENNHVPLILSFTHTPMVYKRNYLQRGDKFNLESNEIAFDVVTEQVFASREDLEDWLAKLRKPGVGKKVVEDEERFLDRSHYWAYVIDERVTSK